MKSPFTGGTVSLLQESRNFEFRKDTFTICFHYYRCDDTAKDFTTNELDSLNQVQVHHKYREKFGIPFIEEIKQIRDQYGLSAAKMSDVLGLGTNVYRNYEAGEMPSVATGRLIRLAGDPNEFTKLLEMSRNVLEPYEYERVKRKMQQSLSVHSGQEEMWKGWLVGNKNPNVYNGYRLTSIEKLGQLLQYFASKNTPFTTAMNKLLFYCDFGHFKKYGQGISGLYYKALPRGPVPENYGGIYNHLVNAGYVQLEEMDFGEYVGEKFLTGDKMEMKLNLFSATELELMEKVSIRFRGLTTRQIVEMSHEEKAWLENAGDKNRISFEYGFNLKNLE